MGTIINIFLPGVGQLVQGRVVVGLLTLLIGLPLTIVGYMSCIVPGLFCHIILLIDAYMYDQKQSLAIQTQATRDAIRQTRHD